MVSLAVQTAQEAIPQELAALSRIHHQVHSAHLAAHSNASAVPEA